MSEYYTKQGLAPEEGEELTVGASVGKVTIPFHSSVEGMKVRIEDASNYVLTARAGNELSVDGRKFAKTEKVAILDVYNTDTVCVKYCQSLEIEGFAEAPEE